MASNTKEIVSNTEELKKKLDKAKQEGDNDYKVRPLVILITEQDDAAFSWFLRNKDTLYNMGYRTLNLEHPCDADFSKVFKQQKALDVIEGNLKSQKFDDINTFTLKWKQYLFRLPFQKSFIACINNLKHDKKWGIVKIDIPEAELLQHIMADTYKIPAVQEKER